LPGGGRNGRICAIARPAQCWCFALKPSIEVEQAVLAKLALKE
jgi:hypothetical protein